ncbi:kinase-like domain-containing protein [Camillea tinctor]|nr:kinase-like domain-containing protein [Camillea tinctor]
MSHIETNITTTQPDPEPLLPSALEDAEDQKRTVAASFITLRPGETLKDTRYLPFRKVGEGKNSSVWLARDFKDNRYVAIKIGRTCMLQEQLRETSMFKKLREHPLPFHPGKDHVIKLLDDFVHKGPSGLHVCLVFPPLGRHVENVLSDFDEKNPAPYSLCRRISIQALKSLDYLHQQDIMHGDVHTGNLVFTLTYDINNDSEADIKAKNTRGNELNDPDDPFTLDDRIEISADGPTDANIMLVDLGASTSPANAASRKFAYPIPYRAPEVVMEAAPVTCKADIWALGCVIYRIVTGLPLFAPEYWGSIDETNLDHICSFIESLGPMPDSLRTGWLDSDRYLTSDGRLIDPYPEDESDLPLAEAIQEAKPKGMEEAELIAFIDFMSFIFHLEPSERSSTQELLQHRWVTDFGEN